MLDKPHHCPDWDFLFIRPGDPEMECCTCPPEDDTERLRVLTPEERDKEQP